MCNFIISTVPADGLAPLGTRTSVGPVMIKFRSHIFVEPEQYGIESMMRYLPADV